MSGALDAGERATAITHLDSCKDCRDLIGALARDATQDAARDTLDAKAAMLAETVPGTRESKPAIASKLGRYTNLERLGAGAMGVVYRADDPGLGRKVALKLLKRPDEELTERLVREARAMAQVSHPNVVAVYDVGVSDDSTYIAMELVDGHTLRAWQSGPHTVAEIVEAYVAAGRGLAAAHDAGSVHRDFKPDNCLVGKGDGRVRVTDFGLAAARTGAGEPSDVDLTSAGSVLGTPAYMAPEQFTGGNVDSRTDQFNFSVSLYEALYGERPFAGRSFDELGDNVCEGRLKPEPAKTRVSRALRGIVLKGMSVKPGDRYATMDHMLGVLGRDRARAWRRAAGVTALVGAILAIGLVADFVVRGRVTTEIRESYKNTRVQTNRAFDLLNRKFEAVSNIAYITDAVNEVSAHYDNADFGLDSTQDDASELERLHQLLVSTDFISFARSMAPEVVLVVADRKGRMLYTSAQLDAWNTTLDKVPGVTALLASAEDKAVIELVHDDDPTLVETKLLGPPHRGLSVMFLRTIVRQKEIRALFIQVADLGSLLADITLDHHTALALVDAHGEHVGDEIPDELLRAAPADDSVAEVTIGGQAYLVQTQTLNGIDARVVAARRVDGVLALFPHARLVFALAMFVALAGASACAFRARQIASA